MNHARRSRIHLDGVPLHIVQRGHNREACFYVEEDYHTWLRAWDTEHNNGVLIYLLLADRDVEIRHFRHLS